MTAHMGMFEVPSEAELSAAAALVCQSVGLEALTRLGTESLQIPRWWRVDSNLQFRDKRCRLCGFASFPQRRESAAAGATARLRASTAEMSARTRGFSWRTGRGRTT